MVWFFSVRAPGRITEMDLQNHFPFQFEHSLTITDVMFICTAVHIVLSKFFSNCSIWFSRKQVLMKSILFISELQQIHLFKDGRRNMSSNEFRKFFDLNTRIGPNNEIQALCGFRNKFKRRTFI